MQIPGPFQPADGVDLLTQMQQAIDSFLPVAAALLPIARPLGFCFACVYIIKTMIDGCVHALLQRPEMIAVELVLCFARIAFVNFMLSYWVTPIPGIGVAFPDIFTQFGREIASVISLTSLDMLLDQLNACWQGLEHPPLWNLFGLVIYYFVLMGMSLLDGALFFIMFLGFFCVALGKVFGSILVTFYLLPGWQSKFHNWITFQWNYSMYRATAAAFSLVIATFMVKLFQNVIHSDFSLGHMIAMAVVFFAAILASVFGAFKVPSINAELFGGGHAGGDFGHSVRNLFILIARRGAA